MTPIEAAVPSGRDESILEHAARAIYNADPQLGPNGPVPWDSQHTPLRAICIAQARAAIKAIREPSEAMIDAASALDDHSTQYVQCVPAEEHWPVMIDVILAEP